MELPQTRLQDLITLITNKLITLFLLPALCVSICIYGDGELISQCHPRAAATLCLIRHREGLLPQFLHFWMLESYTGMLKLCL